MNNERSILKKPQQRQHKKKFSIFPSHFLCCGLVVPHIKHEAEVKDGKRPKKKDKFWHKNYFLFMCTSSSFFHVSSCKRQTLNIYSIRQVWSDCLTCCNMFLCQSYLLEKKNVTSVSFFLVLNLIKLNLLRSQHRWGNSVLESQKWQKIYSFLKLVEFS